MADSFETVAGPQAEAAVTPRVTPPITPAVLDADRRALLAAVLDRIIPPHDGLPGAGELGVAGLIERTLAVSPRLRRLFLEGLVEIELASARAADQGFRDLDAEDQDALLQAVEGARPAFFVALVEHAFRGYYGLPRVHEMIGHESRPPQPGGHRLPPFDPALLAKQRDRAPFWRRTR